MRESVKCCCGPTKRVDRRQQQTATQPKYNSADGAYQAAGGGDDSGERGGARSAAFAPQRRPTRALSLVAWRVLNKRLGWPRYLFTAMFTRCANQNVNKSIDGSRHACVPPAQPTYRRYTTSAHNSQLHPATQQSPPFVVVARPSARPMRCNFHFARIRAAPTLPNPPPFFFSLSSTSFMRFPVTTEPQQNFPPSQQQHESVHH